MPTRTGFRPALLALAAAAALPPATHAQDDPLELKALKVYGDTYRHTATKTALAPAETPQSITVLDPVALELRGVDSVAGALRYVPGVTTELRGGTATRMDMFNIRGFDNFQNYYDGLQLLYNDWNLQPQIDLKAVEQVEVFRGPTSTLYGAMPPGGMVNLIGKRPRTERFNQIEVATGSHDLREASLESTGRIGESDFSYSLVGLVREKDGQARTSREERRMIAPSINWQVSDDTLVNFNLYYQDDPELGIYNTLPAAGLFRPNPNGRLPVDAFAGDRNWDHYEREVTLVGYKINHRFNNDWTFLQNFRYTDATAYQENTYGLGLAGDFRTLARRAYLTDESTEGVTVDNQLTGLVRTGGLEHHLLVGIDYLYMRSDIRYEDAAAPSIDLFAPDHDQIDPGTLDFAASGLSSDFKLTKKQLGFYLQDQIRLQDLVLIAGLRYDDYEMTERGLQYGGNVSRKLKQHKLTSRIGTLYRFASGISPFISYAESYEPLSGSDRFGNAFKPSTGKQWEAGVKYDASGNRASLALAVFRIDKENVPTRDPSGSPYDQIQAGEVRSQGIELEATMRPVDNLLLALTYTYQDVEVTKDNSSLAGKTLVWVPDHIASLWADYVFADGPLAGAGLGAGVRYIGKAALDAANSGTVPSATLVDLAISYDLGELSTQLQGASLSLKANNLLDERYYSCYDADNCWFGAERSIEASIAYSF